MASEVAPPPSITAAVAATATPAAATPPIVTSPPVVRAPPVRPPESRPPPPRTPLLLDAAAPPPALRPSVSRILPTTAETPVSPALPPAEA